MDIFYGPDMFHYSVAMQMDRPRFAIDRPAYNLPDFDREFDKKSRQFPVREKVKKLFRYRITASPQSRHELHVFPSHKLYLWRALCRDQIVESPVAMTQRKD